MTNEHLDTTPHVCDWLDRQDHKQRTSSGWMVRCPAHDDHTPSLSVRVGMDGRFHLKCFAGCDTARVMAAIVPDAHWVAGSERLTAAQANLLRIVALEGFRLGTPDVGSPAFTRSAPPQGGTTNSRRTESLRVISLSWDMDFLARADERVADCRLIVIDPISAYLDGTDANSNHEVRNLLLRLSLVARDRHCAVLLVSHLRKQKEGKAVHRTMGSLAFTAAARAVWSLTADPHDADRRLLLPVKLNIVSNPTGLSFRIVEGRLAWDDAPLAVNAGELTDDAGTHEADATDRLTEARDFLTQFLAAGPQPTVALTEAARTHRIGKPSLWSAKKELAILAFRGTGESNQRWFWKLPDPLDDATSEE